MIETMSATLDAWGVQSLKCNSMSDSTGVTIETNPK